MSDRYQAFTSSPIGKLLVKNLGLPAPVKLERWSEGAPLVDGTVLVGGNGRLGKAITTTLDDLGIANASAATDGQRYKGLVFDATGVAASSQLVQLQEFFTPLMRSLEKCARVLVVGTLPDRTGSN
jgi:3-oxoacyl-[acyl-carrier protein] reductase